MLSPQTTVTRASNLRPEPTVRLSSEEEQRLLTGLLSDDPHAWREFNRRYSRLIYGCISRVTSRFATVVSQDDIREIYASFCLQLLANDKHKLRSFEASRGSRLSSWLGMLAIHATYDFLRGLKREPKWGTLTEAESLSCSRPSPDDVFAVREQARAVREILSGFSEKDRRFVELYFGEGLSPERVAQRLNISIKTVYSKKHKITHRLEALIAEGRLAA